MGIFTKKHSIGTTIANLRKQKGWTQMELAQKLQISDKAISKWEKDNGTPSIEFFPVLAELFDVSIDYLMTGKTPEKEIVTISKTELCAKKDNPKLLPEINPVHLDENGKTLIDYIVQYESINVFIGLCTRSKNNIAYFNLMEAIKMCLISNRLDLLANQSISIDNKRNRHIKYTFKTEYDLLMLAPVQVASYMPNEKHNNCVLTEEFYSFLINDKRINAKTQSFIYGNQFKRECVWYHVFPYLIDYCYLNNKVDQLGKLLSLSVESNNRGFKELELRKNNTYRRNSNYFFVSFNGEYNGHGFVRILEDTIKTALKNGDFKYFEKFNKINEDLIANLIKCMNICDWEIEHHFNAYIASEHEIRIAKLTHDKNVSKDEIAVQSAIYDGIISIDEIIAVKNLKTIKKALNDYPIHPIEKLCYWFSKKNWRKLFEYSVDNKIAFLPEYIIDADEKKISEQLICLFRNKQNYWKVINQKYFDDRRTNYGRSTISSVKDLTEYCKTIKEKVLNDFQNKIGKDRITSELTKEYFEKELFKGNLEIVIIKLCVRLEAILRYRGYEGTFEEMLSKFCGQFNTYDDEDNNYDPHTPRMLNQLRMQRNSIVHSEKNSETMSVSEITACINYICRMN